jgi:cyanophycinase
MAKSRNECPVPSGILVIVGGKENKGADDTEGKEAPREFEKLEILKDFAGLIGKKNPTIEVITSASSEGKASFEDYRKAFEEIGVHKINHIHHMTRKEVMDDDMEERINAADGIYFSGGDQLKLTSLYGGTHWLTLLKERYIYDKIVIGGTSAGAMALSTPMIYAGSKEVEELGGEIKITTGLEFMKDVCIDTHFTNRGRFVRMAQVIVTNPTCIGMGIGEDTAVVVRNGLEAEVIGSGLVIIMDGFHIGDSNVNDFLEKKPISIKDLKVHILSTGNKYNIQQVNPPHK